MSNRICKRCKSTKVFDTGSYCGTAYYRCETCHRLGDKYEFPEVTVFHKITQSPEVLAAAVVYPDWAEYMGGDCWTSPFVERYHTKEEAIAATVEKLKEVMK